MLNAPFGPAVLRSYLRGGWPARLSRDRYLFTGFHRSRPLLEAKVLEKLVRMGMPVPQPLAAQCVRDGLSYTGALLTRRIMPASSLADLLENGVVSELCWFRTGQCIRKFHAVGLVHPDLNARNILISHADGENAIVYLVDFDRAFFRAHATRLFSSNLQRLRRSLLKLWPAGLANQLDACWNQLMHGYNKGNGYNTAF